MVSKKKLVWGIVLAAIGVIGIFSCGGRGAWYIITCIIFMAAGGLLIRSYVKSKKAVDRKAAEESSYQQAQKDAQYAKNKADMARYKAEEARYDAETEKISQAAEATRVCPHCGGTTKGNICEYCGSKLD